MSQPNREKVVAGITKMLLTNPFTFEFEVKEKPQGIKVICEVTKEQMEQMCKNNQPKGGDQ